MSVSILKTLTNQPREPTRISPDRKIKPTGELAMLRMVCAADMRWWVVAVAVGHCLRSVGPVAPPTQYDRPLPFHSGPRIVWCLSRSCSATPVVPTTASQALNKHTRRQTRCVGGGREGGGGRVVHNGVKQAQVDVETGTTHCVIL